MSVHVYMCLYMCVHVSIHVSIHVCIHVCTCVCTCVYTCVYVHGCTCVYTCVYMCVYMCLYMCLCTWVYMCLYMCVHVCTCVSMSILPGTLVPASFYLFIDSPSLFQDLVSPTSGRVPGSEGVGSIVGDSVAGVRGHCGVTGSVEGGGHVTVGGGALGVAHLSWIPDFPLLLQQDHAHPRTTPTRSMARTALSMPSPPTSAVLTTGPLSLAVTLATPSPPPTVGSVLSPESLAIGGGQSPRPAISTAHVTVLL